MRCLWVYRRVDLLDDENEVNATGSVVSYLSIYRVAVPPRPEYHTFATPFSGVP